MTKQSPHKYPLVERYFDELDMLGFPPPPDVKKLQEAAITLIEQHGGGTDEQKEASMLGAAMILYPTSVYIEIGRYFEPEYGPEVEKLVQGLISTPPGAFMPAMLAQANAAAGISRMEDVAQTLKSGRALEGPAPEMLEGMKTAYGQDMSVFSYLDDAPVLLERYESARNSVFAGLERKIRSDAPRRPFKPSGGNFDL